MIFLTFHSALDRLGSFGFSASDLSVGKNQMCLMCGWVQLVYNGFVYDSLRGLERNLANKNRIENP